MDIEALGSNFSQENSFTDQQGEVNSSEKENFTEVERSTGNLREADIHEVNLETANLSYPTVQDETSSEQWLSTDSTVKLSLEETEAQSNVPLTKTNAEATQAEADVQLAQQELQMASLPAGVEPSPNISSQLVVRTRSFRSQLPFSSLFLLWLGYVAFGILLALEQAGWFAWFLAWAGAVGQILNQSLMSLAPVIASVAIISSAPNGAIGTIITVITTLMAVGGLWMMGGDRQIAIRHGVWIGGICGALFLILAWIIEGHTENWFLILLLLVGITAAGFGSTAWRYMSLKGFSKQQTIQTIAGVTGFGLLVGFTLEKLF